MNKKLVGVVIGVLLLFVIVFGGSLMSSGEGAYDYAYYIEANSNFFSKCGLLLNDCCYYAVDIVLSGISSLFGVFLN